ncbi:MAG TPA: stage III sporulation protein AE [Bacillota bacterium]|nr:stage III sporulation protein AE [Bacillota bacterium]
MVMPERAGYLKKIPVLAAAALLLCLLPLKVEAAPDPLVQELEEELDFTYFDRYWSELEQEVNEYLPGLHWRDFLERLQEGEVALDPGLLLSGLGRFLAGEVLLNLKLMGQLLLLAVAAAFLTNLETAFEREQVAALTRGIIFIVLVGICLYTFKAAVEVAGSAINNMVDFTLAMLPTLSALLAAQGSLASSAMLHPLVIFGINFFSTAIRGAIFPLIFLSTVLGLANHFSPHFKVGKLSDFFRDLSTWGIGLFMTIFMGIVTIQGAAGTVSDAVSLRTAKYMTGVFIPVVGKMLADSVETVAGASLMLKNGIFLAGTVVLLLLAFFPLLKLAAMAIVIKLSAALVQPLGENSLGDAINTMGNSLVMIFGVLACAAVLFILAVTVVVGAGNATVMFR